MVNERLHVNALMCSCVGGSVMFCFEKLIRLLIETSQTFNGYNTATEMVTSQGKT